MLTAQSATWMVRTFAGSPFASVLMSLFVVDFLIFSYFDPNVIDSARVPIIIVGMIVGMTEIVETTVMTDTVVIGPGLLPAVAISMVAEPGHLRGGNMMIESLQGTMITGEEAMMTADHLIIMMTAVGMILTEDAMIEDAMKKKIVMKIGLQGLRTVMDGVEDFLAKDFVLWRKIARCSLIAFPSYIGFLHRCGVTVVYRDPVYFSNGWSTLRSRIWFGCVSQGLVLWTSKC